MKKSANNRYIKNGQNLRTLKKETDPITIDNMNKFIKRAHQTAVDKGWWDEPKTFGELMSLIHAELSEALEEFRNHYQPNETYYSSKKTIKHRDGSITKSITISKDKSENRKKPEGIPSELADAVIRIFDLAAVYDLDLVSAIEEKMDYNTIRSYKHGNKVL